MDRIICETVTDRSFANAQWDKLLHCATLLWRGTLFWKNNFVLYLKKKNSERSWNATSFQKSSHIWIFLAACWESAKLTRIKTDSLHSLFGSRGNLSMSFCEGANMSAYAWLQWVYLSIDLVHSGESRWCKNMAHYQTGFLSLTENDRNVFTFMVHLMRNDSSRDCF